MAEGQANGGDDRFALSLQSDGRDVMERMPCVYIMSNAVRGTLYVGVTSALAGRVYQHREGLADGFTRRYGLKRLVWFEAHGTMLEAIAREKTLKRW